jgi:hypothetical protein
METSRAEVVARLAVVARSGDLITTKELINNR